MSSLLSQLTGQENIMLDFKYLKNKMDNEEWIETSLSGKPLLTIPQLNKGTAFTLEERHEFGLLGKLPPQIETLEEQTKRAYQQYLAYSTKLQKHIYLNNLHDKNQVLFYKLVSDHLVEMMPLIYTPIVGVAVKEFSREYRQPRGLYISYPYQDYMGEMLNNRTNPEIDIIVVTDGEGVLGIGDQGVGAMDIPIAKLMVYTLCGGINPLNTLPIQLDVGTNNEKLLKDPFYLGWRHERIQGAKYDEFIERFVTNIKEKFPNVFLHFEDFGRNNARRILDRYRDELCTFNDDIQGTGAAALAALLAAVKANQSSLPEQRIVIFGAGTAGTGIADQIYEGLTNLGLTPEQAKNRLWLVDRPGLLTSEMDLTEGQRPYARSQAEISHWKTNAENIITLEEVVNQIKPTVLIGSSAQSGAFNQKIIQKMATFVEKPIIFPLSNPTEFAEAKPEDILTWTDGKALIATGSPFEDVIYKNSTYKIAQCNNALIFPGIGLGLAATKPTKFTDTMLWAACIALSEYSTKHAADNLSLLPSIKQARHAALHIAEAVAKCAIDEGLATCLPMVDIELSNLIANYVWEPHYCPLRRKK